MSWNIEIFAEQLNSNNQWEPLTKDCIFSNYKHFMLSDYDNFESVALSTINNELIKSFFKDYENEVYIKVCPLSKFKSIHENEVDRFVTKLKVAYNALGLQLEEDCGIFYESSFEEESSNDYVAQLFSMMTFPVNKNLIRELTSDFNMFYKSLKMIGLCDVVNELSNNSIRLLFVNC